MRVLKKIKKNPNHVFSLLPELIHRVGKRLGFNFFTTVPVTKGCIGMVPSLNAMIALERINRLR